MFVDIDVAQPLEMGDHGDAALALDALDEGLAPARHDDVDMIGHREKHADGGPVGGGHELDGALGQAGCGEAGVQAVDDGARRMEALGAAAEYRGVSRLEAQPAGVGGDVGPRFVDDSDDAQRHAHARDEKPVRTRPRTP